MNVIAFHAPKKVRPADVIRKLYKLAGKGKGKKAKRLGSGAFASTYLMPGKENLVIKIGELDDPYLDYIMGIRSSKRKSTVFPKIKEVMLVFEGGTDGMEDREGSYAVVMERLYHPQTDIQRALISIGCTIFSEDGEDEWGSGIDTQTMLEIIERKTISVGMIRKMRRAADWVFDLLDDTGHAPDMHDENIMLRKNGEIVLTDPFC